MPAQRNGHIATLMQNKVKNKQYACVAYMYMCIECSINRVIYRERGENEVNIVQGEYMQLGPEEDSPFGHCKVN